MTLAVYGSLGPKAIQYSGYGNDANYAAVLNVSSNTIVEQTEMIYDAANNAIEQIFRQRYHNAPTTQLGV